MTSSRASHAINSFIFHLQTLGLDSFYTLQLKHAAFEILNPPTKIILSQKSPIILDFINYPLHTRNVSRFGQILGQTLRI